MMQPDNRSSFIPKKSIKRVERVRGGKRVYVLSYIAYAVFFATIVASAVVYFYAQYLEKNLAIKIEELETQRVAFSQSNIEKVKDLERKLKIVEYFYNRHSSAYAVLHEIEQLAVDKVIFKSFNYARQETDEIMISVNGGSSHFDEAAFQTNLLTRSKIFDNIVFTELTKQDQLMTSLDTASNKPNSRSVKVENEAIFTPVSFSFSTLLNFDELVFNPTIYTQPVEDSGVATGSILDIDTINHDLEDESPSVDSELIDDSESQI